MRKHRRFGVVLAVLLGLELVFQSPGTAHHQPAIRASDRSRLAFQLVSANLPAENPPSAAGDAPNDPASRATVHPPATHEMLVQQAVKAYLEAQVPRPAPPPPPRPAPPPAPAPPVAPASGDVWAALRQCESGSNYADNTGNGYYGAYQFSLATWRGLGMTGLPSDATPAAQDQAAHQLQARSGWGQWPACARRLNLV
jgi:Transglycosylase-like domain